MQKPKRYFLYFAMLAASIGVFSAVTRAVDGPQAPRVAVSSIERQHIHSIALLGQDIIALGGQLTETDSFTFESSTGYDDGIQNGVPHTHTIRLSKTQIDQLSNNGNVSIESDESLGHTHVFRFVNDQECPAISLPASSPTPSPTPTETSSPLPLPTPSDLPSPSITLPF